MPTPPLQRTPTLSRLLGPNEVIVYTAKLHPLHGWPWLLAALISYTLAYAVWFGFTIPAVPFTMIYILPFFTNEIAVTTHRLLLRHGRFHLHLDSIDANHLDHYQMHQNPLQAILHMGHIILNLIAGKEKVLHQIHLNHLWHPITFLEALTTLNPAFYSKAR